MYLTRRQKQMLDCIQEFIERNGYSPTLQEIGGMLGLSSPATIHKHLQNLESRKLIRRRPNQSRAIELTPKVAVRPSRALPLLGTVAAGRPIEAVEQHEQVEVPPDLLRSGENFVLRVQGDSMIEDGILDGDLIVVEKRETALPGQTVVALIDGEEATVKHYRPQGKNRIRLEPANSTMEPMTFPAESVRIQGVVIGLIRKYAA